MKTLTAVVAAALSLGALADDYYVNADPEVSSDAYDGTTVTNIVGTNHGPKPTIAAVLTLDGFAAGSTIHVAEGIYDMGEMWDGYVTNRVYVTQKNVAIIASGRRDKTVIEGHISEQNETGLGTDGVRCIHITGSGSYVRGFTIRNGRTYLPETSSDSNSNGGNIYGGSAVDCVITNGYAGFRGGLVSAVTCIGCTLADGNSGAGIGAHGGSYYNCLIRSAPMYVSGKLVNCTLFGCSPRGTSGTEPYNCSVYNSYVDWPGKQSNFYNCRLGAMQSGSFYADDCKIVTKDEAKLDPETYMPLPGSPLVDEGSNELYAENFTASFPDMKDRDLQGNPRIANGTIDIGAFEMTWAEVLRSALGASPYLTIEDPVGEPRAVNNGTSVSLDPGEGFTAAWSCPTGYIESEDLSFTASVEGSGLLKVYLIGESAPQWVISSATGEVRVPYSMSQDHKIVFLYEGADGAASVRALTTTAHVAYFVDANFGNDESNGLTRATARRTLKAAMEIPTLASGDVVHAAAGIYAEGEFWDGYNTNRVIVPAGVGLVADEGPEKTAIEGHVSDLPDSASGCGRDAVRSVKLSAGAWLRGFTVRNGRTQNENTGNNRGGGVAMGDGAAIIGCVISNCVACSRAGGTQMGTAIACRYVGNTSSGYSKSSSANGTSMYDCLVESGDIWTGGKIVNSTVRAAIYGDGGGGRAFNTLMTGSLKSSMTAYRCLVGGVLENSTALDGTRTGLSGTAILAMVDGNFVPLAGSDALDFGDVNHYITNFPAAWVRFRAADFAGEARVQNAAIDCGAVERPWLDEFAGRILRGLRSPFTLVAASAGVTTNALGAVTLADFDSLDLTLTCEADDEFTFAAAVTGGGSLFVSLDGAPVSVNPSTGLYMFAAAAGSHAVRVSFAGGGNAVVSDFRSRAKGLLLIFR